MLLSVSVLKVDTASSLERASCLMRVWDRFTGSTAGKQDTSSESHVATVTVTLKCVLVAMPASRSIHCQVAVKPQNM